MVIAKKHKKLVKFSIYIGLLLVTLFWVILGATRYANSNFNTLLSNNAAVLTDVASLVENTDDISVIQPSRTSGRLPGVVSAYNAVTEASSANRLQMARFFTIGLHANNEEVTNLSGEATTVLDDVAYRVTIATSGLNLTQKFIEYDPVTDLEGYKNGQEPGASERLSRTQIGIQNTIQAAEGSNLPYRKDIIMLLKPLETKALKVTPQTVDLWAGEVLVAQKKILTIIQTDYDSDISSSTQKLRDISERYLQLR